MPFSESQWRFFWALSRVVVPSVERLDEKGRAQFKSIVTGSLRDKPRHIVRRFKLFLTVLRWSTLPVFFRPLDALAAARQARVIRFFESVPIRLLRIGTWGVKTLVFMGYYGQPEIARRAGYVPAFDGNGAIGEGKRV